MPVALEAAGEAEPVAVAETAPVVEGVEEPEPSFDELFTLKSTDVISAAVTGDEEEEEEGNQKGKKKKEKKKGGKKFVEITYDPDADVTLARKVHKRDDGWEWE
ncbi:MAG: hypothetical protein HY835_01645 [Anaerolineae bacterium]|nr:hypothetical protein [Anaerolineae bacterium]